MPTSMGIVRATTRAPPSAATPEARSKIAEGAIYGDVVQNPTRIGELTIQAIHDLFSGKTPAATIPVAVGVVTRDSL